MYLHNICSFLNKKGNNIYKTAVLSVRIHRLSNINKSM
jgi:hypothetical protein